MFLDAIERLNICVFIDKTLPKLIVGSKVTVCFVYFVFKGNFPSTSPRRGDLMEGSLRYRFGGLICVLSQESSEDSSRASTIHYEGVVLVTY